MRPKRLIILLLLVVLAGTAGPGCGIKSAPMPLQYYKPERIPDLVAVNAKGGIQLTWHRPEHRVGGGKLEDLADFTIMRAEAGGPPQQIARVLVTNEERFHMQHTFTYEDAAVTAGQTYRYQVGSETADGYQSDLSNEMTIVRRMPPPPPSPENFVLPGPAPLP